MSSERRVVYLGQQILLWAFVGALATVSCSSGNGSGGNGGTGGAMASGGSGGMSASGGTTTATGGTVGSGGQLGSGGTPATGGSSSNGGAAGGSGGAASGGTVGSGGSQTTASGGRSGSGGEAAGGTLGSGGAGSGGATGKNDASGDGPDGNPTGGTGVAGAGGNGSGGGTGAGGTTGTGGGAGGSSECAGRVISLGANGSGSDSDSAQAHVEIDMKTDLPTGNAKRTVEFWAFIRKTDWVGEKNQIYYYGDGSGANTSFGLDFGTNNVTGSTTNHATLNPFTGSDIRDDSGKDLGINSSTDQWVHIAMTWDGSAFVTYVNGLPKITVQATGSTTTLNTKQSGLMIGCNPTNNNCFGGYFDELRVWNVARSATEIKDNYDKPVTGNETGLVGYWKFDETSGTTAADAVTSDGHTAHDGTLKADTTAHNPTFVAPSVPLPLVCP